MKITIEITKEEYIKNHVQFRHLDFIERTLREELSKIDRIGHTPNFEGNFELKII